MMTEKQKSFVEKVVAIITQELQDDEFFEKVIYRWNGYDWVDLIFSVKQQPGWAFRDTRLSFDDMDDPFDTATKIAANWKETVTEREVNGFIKFIEIGSKYGWD